MITLLSQHPALWFNGSWWKLKCQSTGALLQTDKCGGCNAAWSGNKACLGNLSMLPAVCAGLYVDHTHSLGKNSATVQSWWHSNSVHCSKAKPSSTQCCASRQQPGCDIIQQCKPWQHSTSTAWHSSTQQFLPQAPGFGDPSHGPAGMSS